MSPAPDWDRFVRRHWEKSPACLSLGPPAAPPEQVFQVLREVSAPFRFGTRFRALPDVKFFTDGAQLRAPGPLLPGDSDRDVTGYVRRVAAEVGSRKFQLLVEQPFLAHFPLWDTLRQFVRGLLERTGLPVLPIATDAFVGDFARAPQGAARRPHHAVLTLVLQGKLRVRAGKTPSRTTTLEAKAGDVLYVPSSFSQHEECRGPCMAVRLWIPVQGSRPSAAVKDVLVTLLEPRLPEDHAVPYLDYPWKPRRGIAGAWTGPLKRAAAELDTLTRGPDLLQALRIIWTRRVSACALEPVPPPQDVPPLKDTQRIRGSTSSRVVRMQDSPGQWIWAINGHAFPMQESPESLQLLEAIASGTPLPVGALCRQPRRASRRQELRQLLETLHALRAVELLPEERS